MEMYNSSLSGGRHRNVTNAHIAARDAYIAQHTKYNIYEDFNVFINRYLLRYHGKLNVFVPNPNYDPNAPLDDPRSDKELPGMIDFTKLVLNVKDMSEKIKSDDKLVSELRDAIKNNSIVREHFIRFKTLEYLRQHVQQNVPPNVDITDDTLLTSPEYTNLRSGYPGMTAFTDAVNRISNIEDIIALETELPNPDVYTALLDIMKTFAETTCCNNIVYRLLSTTGNDYLNRSRVVKAISDLMNKEYRSESMRPYDVEILRDFYRYNSKINHEHKFFVKFTITIGSTIQKLIDITNLNALKALFPHNIPLHPHFNDADYNNTINMLFANVKASVSKMTYLLASQYKYMYYDVVGSDLINNTSTDNLQVKPSTKVERIELNTSKDFPSYYETANIDDDVNYHPNAYYASTPDRNISEFIGQYFRAGRRYNKPFALNRENNRMSTMDDVSKTVSIMFAIESIAVTNCYMQILNDFVAYIIKDSRFTIYDPYYNAIYNDYTANMNGIRAALGPFKVNGGDIMDEVFMFAYSPVFKFLAILCLVIFVIYVMSKLFSSSSGTKKVEKYTPRWEVEQPREQCDHDREYQIYEYVTNQVDCDAEHLMPTELREQLEKERAKGKVEAPVVKEVVEEDVIQETVEEDTVETVIEENIDKESVPTPVTKAVVSTSEARDKATLTRRENPSAAVNVDGTTIENDMHGAVERTE